MIEMTAKDPGPKSVIDHHLDELANVHLLKSPDRAYSIEFRGNFGCQSFASVGIILMRGHIFKVLLLHLYFPLPVRFLAIWHDELSP